jgi:hypothetical protein
MNLEDPTRSVWLVVDADGRLRGRVELPARATMRWIDGDQAWLVEPDEFEVPWLVRYRLAEPPRP